MRDPLAVIADILKPHFGIGGSAAIAHVMSDDLRDEGHVIVSADDLRTVMEQRHLHAHERPGVWDADNRDKAGEPCVECAARSRLQAALPAVDKRASVDDLLGADPDWPGGQDVDDYIREARRDY